MNGRSALTELIALVAPPACLACRAPLAGAAELLCAGCLRELPWLRGRRCARCGLPRHGRDGCPASAAAFAAAWAPMAYAGPAKALVQALKFHAALPAVGVMAAQMAATLPRELRAGVVAGVPAQRARRRARGFDPTGALARELAGRLGLPYAALLTRRDCAPRQARASRAARRAAGRIVVDVAGAPATPVLLVDDVHTTGATLDACAGALLAAGAPRVVAVTYARTL